MSSQLQHRFQPKFWPQMNQCRICSQDRQANIHFQQLAPVLQEVRNMMANLRRSLTNRRLLSANELTRAIAEIADAHGTEYKWIGRSLDARYLAAPRKELPLLLRDHYFNLLGAGELDLRDCDNVAEWVKVWLAGLNISAVCIVEDYGSPLQHAYNLIIHDDLSGTFLDGAGPHVPYPPEGVKYRFQAKVELRI